MNYHYVTLLDSIEYLISYCLLPICLIVFVHNILNTVNGYVLCAFKSDI